MGVDCHWLKRLQPFLLLFVQLRFKYKSLQCRAVEAASYFDFCVTDFSIVDEHRSLEVPRGQIEQEAIISVAVCSVFVTAILAVFHFYILSIAGTCAHDTIHVIKRWVFRKALSVLAVLQWLRYFVYHGDIFECGPLISTRQRHVPRRESSTITRQNKKNATFVTK